MIHILGGTLCFGVLIAVGWLVWAVQRMNEH